MSLPSSRHPEATIWRPYTQMRGASPPIAIESAEEARLYGRDGRTYIDAISSWWVITHGHCHPRIQGAIAERAARLDQLLFADFTHGPAEQLVTSLASLLPPSLRHFFFSDNGSTAVEVALKIAYQAAVQSGHPQRKRFLAFAGGYHGDTVGAMSVGGRSSFTKPYEPLLFDVLRAEHPRSSQARSEDWTRDFKRLLRAHGNEIAGVILEPLVQGAAGMIVWPEDAVREIAACCRQERIPLIFDEVMTGFGRTGALFALEKCDVVPDLLCLSKGLTGGSLPLSLTITHSGLYDAFLAETQDRMLFHGHSFTGNPLACAAAVANLELFDASVWKRLKTIEDTNRSRAQSLAARVRLRDLRLCGTIAALELETDETRYGHPVSRRIKAKALERGVFLRPLGNILYVMPPYSITASELDLVWDVIEDLVREI